MFKLFVALIKFKLAQSLIGEPFFNIISIHFFFIVFSKQRFKEKIFSCFKQIKINVDSRVFFNKDFYFKIILQQQ